MREIKGIASLDILLETEGDPLNEEEICLNIEDELRWILETEIGEFSDIETEYDDGCVMANVNFEIDGMISSDYFADPEWDMVYSSKEIKDMLMANGMKVNRFHLSMPKIMI